MRAGLAASARWFGCFGPGDACEAMLRLRGYGFVLQPTDTARAVTDARITLGAAPGARVRHC